MKVHEDHAFFERKTNPQYTKRVNVQGKQAFTNIDTYYLIEEATKAFGLFGKGWGLKSTQYEKETIGETILLVLHATFFFRDGEFPISNAIKMAYKTKAGYMQIDEDAWKKLETNTIAKALSRIGFGADVYMGEFDDAAYVQEAYEDTVEINRDQLAVITRLIAQTKTDTVKFREAFGIEKIANLLVRDYEKAVTMLQAKLKKDENHA